MVILVIKKIKSISLILDVHVCIIVYILAGFEDPWKICCGHHENEVHVWCGQRGVVNGGEIVGAACASPATCISWDGVNFTQAANHWVANHILNGSFSEPHRPISQACFKH